MSQYAAPSHAPDRTIGTSRVRTMVRGILALLAGLGAIVVLSLGTDVVLHATGIYPPWFEPMGTPLWALATGYRIVYGVLGGYITARLAQSRPMRHAIILGVLGIALSLIGVVATWDSGPEFGPKWYSIGLVVIALPCSWAGARLRQRHS